MHEIEEKLVIYSSLQEATILPAGIIDKNANFTFWKYFPAPIEYNFTKNKNGYPFTLKNDYLDGIFLKQYAPYYNFSYKNKIIGVTFTDDTYAEEQYQIRKNLYNIKGNSANLRFGDIKKYDYFPITKKSNNSYSLKYEAIINHQSCNLEKAEQLYKDYININSIDYDAMLKLGKLYEEIEDYNKAINLYKKLYVLNENNITYISKLTNAYLKNKNYKKDLELNSKLLELEDKMINLYINQVIIYKALNDEIKLQEFILNTQEQNHQYGKEISNFLFDRNNDNFKEYKLLDSV